MIVSTTQTNPWMMVSAQKTAPTNYIEIQPGELRQTIRGFGGCFSGRAGAAKPFAAGA